MTSNQAYMRRMRERSDLDDAASSPQPPPAKRCRLEQESPSFSSRFTIGVADLLWDGYRWGTQTFDRPATASYADEDPAPSDDGRVVLHELFRKELTPSDVGKLNRLVIPKKQAERHFPRIRMPGCRAGGGRSDSPDGTVEGMMLEFRDAEGRSWEFRYCYWRSSQSFVFTKGWNKFIRTKRVREGDVVAFYRCDCKDGRRKPFCMIDVMHGAGIVGVDDSNEFLSSLVGGRHSGEDGGVGLNGATGRDRAMYSPNLFTPMEEAMGRTRDYCEEERENVVSTEPDLRDSPGKKSFMLFGVQIASA